jgi:hypothetical protein
MGRNIERRRRVIVAIIVFLVAVGGALYNDLRPQPTAPDNNATVAQNPASASGTAVEALGKLAVKGSAPKTGYSREQFGGEWADEGACDMRNKVLARDLTDVKVRSKADCTVSSGTLNDPYTGKVIQFVRGPGTSTKVQIDHVVAISDAWQTGAQQLSAQTRKQLYNDPLELLAVDGPANNQKSDGDAATWLPSNKPYRCRYVARQIAVKAKYHLWVTPAEHDAMQRVLGTCPSQQLPTTNK